MANLYDTQAQAQFINTYVPIQFENLYKMADKATENKERAYAMMDDLSSYRSLGSVSGAANKAWEDRFGSQISKLSEEAASDPSVLSSPEFRGRIRSLKNSISGSPEAKALMESKEAYKATLAKVDPKWGGHYMSKISSHDPTKSGIWAENPLEYSDWNKVGDELTKDLGPRKLGVSKDGVTQLWGIAKEDVMAAINDNSAAILSDLSNIETAKAELARLGIQEGMSVETKDGKKIPYQEALNTYILDAVQKSAFDKANRVEERVDPVALNNLKMQSQWALEKYRQSQLNRRAAEKNPGKDVINSITSEWEKNALAETTQKKFSKVLWLVEQEIVNNQKKMSPKEAHDAARNKFGEHVYNYWDSKRKIRWGKKGLSNARIRLANAVAAGDKAAINAANDEIANIEKDLRANQDKSYIYSDAVLDNINEQSLLASSGRSKWFSKEEAAVWNRYPVPSAISNAWAEINIGQPIKLKTSKNVDEDAYMASNLSRFEFSSPVYGNSTVKGAESLVSKINSKMKNNISSVSSYYRPGGSAKLRGSGADIDGHLLVPESVLANEWGLSSSEIKQLRSIPGAASQIIRAHRAPKEVMTTNKKGETTLTTSEDSEPIKVIAIPVSSRFLGDSKTEDRTMLDALIEKDYKLSKVGQQQIVQPQMNGGYYGMDDDSYYE